MEMISMNDLKSRGDFAKMREELRKEGFEQGIELVLEKTLPKLLETMTPEDISKEFEISLERVLEIKNSYEK